MTQNEARKNHIDLMGILRYNSTLIIHRNDDPALPTILCSWLPIKAIDDFVQS